MPVRFYVDSHVGKDITNITLSYNFIKIKDADKPKKDGLAGL